MEATAPAADLVDARAASQAAVPAADLIDDRAAVKASANFYTELMLQLMLLMQVQAVVKAVPDARVTEHVSPDSSVDAAAHTTDHADDRAVAYAVADLTFAADVGDANVDFNAGAAVDTSDAVGAAGYRAAAPAVANNGEHAAAHAAEYTAARVAAHGPTDISAAAAVGAVAGGRPLVCNKMMRISQTSRILCTHNSERRKKTFFDTKFFKTKIWRSSSKSVSNIETLERPSASIFQKLFHKNASKALAKAAAPSF